MDYVPACTFTPLARNRFRCNCCTVNGHPVILGRSQVDSHRTSKFFEKNPRLPLPPPTAVASRRSARPVSTNRYIWSFAMFWVCPKCLERNDFKRGYGTIGFAGPATCSDCGHSFAIYRDG